MLPASTGSKFACFEYECFHCAPKTEQIFHVVQEINSFVTVSNFG